MLFKPFLALILCLIENISNLNLSMLDNAIQIHLPVTESNEIQEKKSGHQQTLPENNQNKKFDIFLENIHSKGVKYIKYLHNFNIVDDLTYTVHNEFSSAFWFKVVKIEGVILENSRNEITLAKPVTRQDEVRVHDDVVKVAKDILAGIVKKYVSSYERGNYLRTIDTLYNDLNEPDNGKRKSNSRLRVVVTQKRDFKQYICHLLSVIQDIDESYLSKLMLTAVIEFQKLKLANIVSERCENNIKNELAKLNVTDVNLIKEDIQSINYIFNGISNLQYKNIIGTVNNNTKITKDWDRYESELKEWISGKRIDIEIIVRKWYHYVLNETVGRWDDGTKLYIRNQIESLVHASMADIGFTTVGTINYTVI